MKSKFSERATIIQRVLLVAAVLLVVKVASLQLFDANYNKQAEARTLDKRILYPSRGLVYDRDGELLVYNNPIYDLQAVYNNIDEDIDTAAFCDLLDLSIEDFNERMNKPWGTRYSRAVPFVFEKHISPVVFAKFQEDLHEFTGFSEVLRNVRGYTYPYAGHVLGYISEVDNAIIDSVGLNYEPGDYMGVSGIEKTYEQDLRGRKGVAYVLRDNVGRDVANVQSGRLGADAASGADIQLTLDIDLQGYGEQLMKGKKGSIVCIEPGSGEILAMVSTPGFDPATLTIQKGRTEAFNALQNDTLKPFFDRSLMAAYPPGSIFKTVLALVALQEGTLAPNQQHYCDGAYYYNNRAYGCHDHEHPYNVAAALQHSCNSYFFQVFRDLIEKDGFREAESGLNNLNAHLSRFGLGNTLGIDLPNEKAGNLPESSYYDDLYGKGRWRSTYIMSLGIGQGELLLTTLQMANLASIIANRGHFYTPHVIKRFVNNVKLIPERFSERQTVGIEEEHFAPVIQGMQRAVNMGTAVGAYHPDISICGKTGTSENPHGEDNSVFFAFAPKDDPQIAVAVYVENAGWGGTYAAPIASLMIERYLTGSISPSRGWIEKRMVEADLISKP